MSLIQKIKSLVTQKQFFLKFVVPAIAALLLCSAILQFFKNPKRKTVTPKNPVTVAVFVNSVSGIGVTEPKGEIIEIGTNLSGVASQVYVKAGDTLKKGSKLFTIDDREAKANLELKISGYKSAQLDAEDKKREFLMYKEINDERAYSKDEFNKKRIAAQISEQSAKQAKAEAQVARIMVDKSTVKSPIKGEVLKVNIRPGEFAQAGALSKPLMTIGDLSKMHVRIEIDELDAHRFKMQNKAVGLLRGQPDFKIPLQFVRIEPLVVSKVSISGGNSEKIDSRVLQVIYSFDNNFSPKILVGQQLDVYIEDK
jgi:RND family efflux transporter MFP subunit